MAPTTRTNQQAYCKVINKDIDRESKYLFTYTQRERERERERKNKILPSSGREGFLAMVDGDGGFK